ncbi:MAG: GNAT family N-acetyltransferase [Polyangiaceae bacterium]|nr:GNAT family N-acetyltransferase [Polyangiaceae bacterium]
MLTTKSIAKADLGALGELLRSYRYKPLYYYRASSEEARWRYFEWTLERLLAQPEHVALATCSGAAPTGFVAGEVREWDSAIIGRKAAMLGPVVLGEGSSPEQREGLLRLGLDGLRQLGVEHVTTRCEADDLEHLHLLESHGFITVDSIVHLAWDLRAAAAPVLDLPAGVEIREHRADDVGKLKAIARAALRADRFHNDPVVDQERAHDVYATWVENACLGLDDAVAVGVLEGEPIGFMTAKILPQTGELLGTKVGKLWIGSLSPKARGKGLYGNLASYLIGWLAARGVEIVEGGTQTRNIPALRSLCRRGFLPVNSMTTLRVLL